MEIEAIKDRGRAMGLNPRRERVVLSENPKRWRKVKAHEISQGDLWADHGVVVEVEQIEGDERVVDLIVMAGLPDPKPYRVHPEDEVFMFG